MLGRNKYGQGTQKLEDAAGGNSLKDTEEEVSRLWPTQSLPTEAVMGPRLWVAGTVIVSDVLLVAACHLACVVTNQGDALLATRAGYSPTQVNG